MDRKLVLISACAAIAGVGLLRLYLHRMEAEVAGGPPTPVMIVTRDVPVGTPLDRDMLSIRQLPEAYLESRHVVSADLDKVLGARLSVAARANEALLWTDLASMHRESRQLSSLVPEGRRAITVEMRAGSFDELLRPGDRVDVLFTRSEGAAGTGTTRALLQNVLVLAVGADVGGLDTAERNGRGGRAGGRVTLSVTTQQGQVLVQADQEGALRLALRNPDDIVVADSTPTTTGDPLAADSRVVTSERFDGR